MISGCREADSKRHAATALPEPRHILLGQCNSHLARALSHFTLVNFWSSDKERSTTSYIHLQSDRRKALVSTSKIKFLRTTG